MNTQLLPMLPPKVIADALDSILIDYCMLAIKDQQSVNDDQAIENIKVAKQLRDAFIKAAEQN